MSNDSTLNTKSTPATDGAHARQKVTNDAEIPNRSALAARFPTHYGAHARHVARLVLDRNGDIESTEVDNKRYFRDTDLGRVLNFSRPRDIRKPIQRMIESGDIPEDQFILVDDEDSGQVFYLDNMAAMKLAVRTKSVTEAMIMKMIATVSNATTKAESSISSEKAISGYHRTVSFLSKKDMPRAGKLAMVPVLEKYARAAGLPIPDVSDLIGPDQPRLDGV